MSIRDDLKALTTPHPNQFEAWLDTLTTDDKEALTEAATNTGITHRALYDVVKAHGAKVGKERLTTWRKSLGFPS